METTTLDGIARTLGSSMTRRSALRGLFTGAAAVAGGAVLQSEDASAKRRKKGKTGRKQQTQTPGGGQTCGGTTPFLPSGALCQRDSQCNAQQNQICEVPHGASNSDTRCCGAQGAICGGVNEEGDALGPFCCIGEAGVRSYVCSQRDPATPFVPGTCIPAPADE